MKWGPLFEQSRSMNEQHDCSVRAVTVVSGKPYEDVHDVFTQCGRKNRKRTPPGITTLVLARLSLCTENVTSRFGAKTIRTLERELKGSKGCYLVHTRGHILGVRDGEVVDWTRGCLHRIQLIQRVWEKK